MGLKEDDTLSLCRFYKGETVCPFKDGDKQMFWLCEKWWTEQAIPATDAGCEHITPILKEYTDAGLSSFELYDGVPITLKAVLFNRYCKYAESVDIEDFRKMYLTKYVIHKNSIKKVTNIVVPEITYIENLSKRIEYHIETKSPFTVSILNGVKNLEKWVDKVFESWCNNKSIDLGNEILTKMNGIKPMYYVLFHPMDNDICNAMSDYLNKRKILFEDIRWFIDTIHTENNVEQTNNSPSEHAKTKSTKRGRRSKPFKDYLQNDKGDGTANLNKLHDVMRGKNGKEAALVMKTAIQIGWITKPTFKAVKDEFGDIGNRSNYNKYINNDVKLSNDEIDGMKSILLS